MTRVPDAGHSVYFEKPDIFNFAVLRFIQGVAAPATAPAARTVDPATAR